MVATELGGAGRVDLEVLAQARVAVRRLLVHWGLLDADPQADEPVGETRFIHLAPGGGAVVHTHGLLEPTVRLGDEIEAGGVVARVHPLEDLSASAEVVRAPTSGIVTTLRTPPLVRRRPRCKRGGAPDRSGRGRAARRRATFPHLASRDGTRFGADQCLAPTTVSVRRFMRNPVSLGPFPDDLSRALVVAKPEKARLAQPSVTRPFGKSDLSDEVGPCPVRAAGIGRASTNAGSAVSSSRSRIPRSRSVALV